MSFLRSWLFTTPLIVLATIVMGAISIAASLFDPTGRASHRVARRWARIVLAVSFIRVRAEGLENIRSGGSYVFVANHTSYMDIPAVLALVGVGFRFFAKKGLFLIPFLGTHLKRAGHIAVDRSSPRASFKSMARGAEMVAEKNVSVLIFPEGGRTAEGQGLREFREGAAYIAIKAGVPAVPIAILGLQPLLPMGSLHIRSGRGLVRIGKPIDTAGMGHKDRAELNRLLYEELARLTGQPVAQTAMR